MTTTLEQKYSISSVALSRICDTAQADFQKLRDARIFLTGCTGFLGKWIVESLLWADEHLHLDLRLFVLTRSAQSILASMPQWENHSALELLEGDVLSWQPKSLLGITHIIHGANYTNSGSQDWALRHMDTAFLGLRRILDMAVVEKCRNILLLSSGAVYRLRTGKETPPFCEQEKGPDDYLQEPNVYAVCKYVTEMYAAAFGREHGIRIPVARLFTFFGQHMPQHRRQALSSFVQDARAGKDIVIAGDGKAVRSYMHAADMVICCLAILVHGRHGTPYNVGSEQPVSIRDLAEMVSAASGKGLPVHILGQAAGGNAPEEYVPDTSALRALMKREPAPSSLGAALAELL